MRKFPIAASLALFGTLLTGFFLWHHAARLGKEPEGKIHFVPLKAIPGISKEVLEAQGKILQIEEPVLFLPALGVYHFEVKVQSATFEFAGDAPKILHFVKEIQFVTSNTVDWSDKSLEVVNGGRDAVESMIEGLWGVFRHPVDTLSGLGSAASGFLEYATSFAQGQVNPTNDISNFANAYFTDKCMSIASDKGLNFQELETTQAKALIVDLAKYKVGGQMSVEIVTLFLAFTKISKVASLTKLGRYGSLFRYGAMAEIGASRAVKFQEAVRAISNLERLAPLLNPHRIATLATDNALNARLNKVMYYLRQEELGGKSVSESLLRSMKMSGADKRLAGPRQFCHPKLDHAQLLKNYETLKKEGVFEVAQNMKALKRGGSTITRSGNRLDVNHIVPKSLAPELENSWANLEYMDSSLNRSLGNSITKSSRDKLDQFQKVGAIGDDRLKKILENPSR